MTPVCAVAAVIFDGERVLVIQRGKPPGEGLWSVPGGKLEAGETLAAAVAREVAEETGLVVEVGPLVTAIERIGEGYHFVILDYLARAIGGTLQAASDVRDARWVTDAELAAMAVTEGLLEVIGWARRTPWHSKKG